MRESLMEDLMEGNPKYRLQHGEITELKLQEYVTATKTHIRTMDFVIDNIDDFHNKFVAMMK
jgi:tRNA A37 threonylcarbamoyladenosine dehydratase